MRRKCSAPRAHDVLILLMTGTIAIMGVDQRKTKFLGLSGIWPSRDPQIASAHA